MTAAGARVLGACALAAALAGCPKKELPHTPDVPVPKGPCLRWRAPAERVGEVPAELEELSGLVASRAHPELYWAHNDSGNALELFALRQTGEVVARFPLEGVTAPDVEDVAVGPCVADPARTCVLLGDIGDNLAQRPSVQVLEVEEPSVLDGRTLPARAFAFRYPEGPRDAEALLVDPVTGVPHVLSKTWDHLGDLYRLEGLNAGAEVEAVHLGALQTVRGEDRYATAADTSPDGARILLRTYSRVWEIRGEGPSSLQELLAIPAVEVPAAPQPQAEAVAYAPDGRAYLLGTEGAGEGLFRVNCLD